MEACGIVAEYNPFHNGHFYQIEVARKRSRSDIIIVVMSGNFLQRGEPALIDKWARAEMALRNGADIVLELPVLYSVQPADLFAKGAIDILHSMKCTTLSFGSESGDGKAFAEAAEYLVRQEQQINEIFKQRNEQGLTYAVRMQRVIDEVLPELSIDLSLPNNQLGLAYAKENVKKGSPLSLEVIHRKQAGYHENSLQRSGKISSATSIRRQLLSKELDSSAVVEFLPSVNMAIMENRRLQHWEDYWKYLKYQLLTSTKEDLKQIYQVEEGLENLLINAAGKADSFESFMKLIKHKRMTRTRLQRLCVYVLLQIKKVDVDIASETGVKATRLLGFSKSGQSFLRKVKKDREIELLTKIDRNNSKTWQWDIRAGNLYQLGSNDEMTRQDFGRIPIKSIDINLDD